MTIQLSKKEGRFQTPAFLIGITGYWYPKPTKLPEENRDDPPDITS